MIPPFQRTSAFRFANVAQLLAVLVSAVCATGPKELSLNMTSPGNVLPCKYSVRDVAFVNVHGRTWQLQLIRAKDTSPTQFNEWNSLLQSKLERTNIGHIWFDAGSPEASQLSTSVLHSSSPIKNDGQPTMGIRGPDGTLLPIPSNDKTFEQQLDALVSSSYREKILEATVQSLCVFVLIESDVPEKNQSAIHTTSQAIEQLERQMWTLEKPTDQGAELVVIPKEQLDQESWLIQSLGVDPRSGPSLAVVYGQARRLGEPIIGAEITTEKLVGRASLCGRDCECDLNRQWLYGNQFLHRWTQQLSQVAEDSLSFDPQSAFVIAEVAQIIQKNNGPQSDDSIIDLGSGLIIHDLDSAPDPPSPKTDATPPKDHQSQITQSESETIPQHPRQEVGIGEAGSTLVAVPWSLILAILFVVAAAIIWAQVGKVA